MDTIRRALGEDEADRWNEDAFNDMTVEEFSSLLGPLTVCDKDEELMGKHRNPPRQIPSFRKDAGRHASSSMISN